MKLLPTRAPALVPAFVFLLLLSACAGPPVRAPAEIEAAWQARQARLAQLDVWDLRGRLAVRASDDGGQAALRWQRRGQVHELTLTGPLGKQLLQLVEAPDGARLRDGRRELVAPDAQALLWEATGWQVPLAGLRYWIVGLPAPGFVEPELDGQGRLARVRQLGWDVRFADYMTVDGLDLPRRMVLRYPAAAGGESEVELRLLVQTWTLSAR